MTFWQATSDMTGEAAALGVEVDWADLLWELSEDFGVGLQKL